MVSASVLFFFFPTRKRRDKGKDSSRGQFQLPRMAPKIKIGFEKLVRQVELVRVSRDSWFTFSAVSRGCDGKRLVETSRETRPPRRFTVTRIGGLYEATSHREKLSPSAFPTR